MTREVTGSKKGSMYVILLYIVCGFMFFTMYYGDLVATIQHAMIYIDSLFDGEFLSFYNNALAQEKVIGGAAYYDIGIYFVFAIWGLPVYLLREIFLIDILSVGSLLWFKFLLVLLVIGIKIILEKIAKEIGIPANKETGWYWLLSPLMIFPVLVTAQYDIIPIFVMLIGVYYSIKNQMKRSTVIFALSFTMKPITVLAFVIVLLFKERSIFNIVKYSLLGIIPLAICKGIYMTKPSSTSTNNSFFLSSLNDMFSIKFEFGNEKVSLFALVFFVICISCYIHKFNNDKEQNDRWLIWYLYLAWLSFCILTPIAPYWVIYLAPFSTLLTFFNADIDRMMLLETIAGIGFIGVLIHKFSWVYGGNKTYAYLFLKDLQNTKMDIPTVAGGITALGLDSFMPVVYALSIASFIVIAYREYPGLKESFIISEKDTIKIIWWIKILFLYMWAILTLALLLFSR